ncbi:MAG: site-specific DNA-methyltransferase [Ignavibacteria bacterium]
MFLQYKNKKEAESILNLTDKALFAGNIIFNENLIIKGDNLPCLKSLLDVYARKIDLVYIDPPFSTNNIFRAGNDRVSTISSNKKHDIAYTDKLKEDEFLEFIRERLIFLRELLSDKGSIYLHIDYKTGHYIKIIMDEVFGRKNFRNDISRIKCNPKNFRRKAYGNIKDMILFYTKTSDYVWNEPLTSLSKEQMNKLFNKTDTNGRKYTTNPLHAPGETTNGKSGQAWKGMPPPEGRHWRHAPEVLDQLETDGLIQWSKNGVPRKIIFADDYGQARLQDVWEFKDSQKPAYPTEKKIDMLKTIIKTSSDENSFVLDCFCGSGNTLLVAAELDRKWIGIDNSDIAITICRKRFEKPDTEMFQNNYKYSFLQQK